MMRPSQFVRIHSLVTPNVVIQYDQRYCGSHSSWSPSRRVLGSTRQSALEAKSGATIGMSHLRHKRAEDLRPDCVTILLHRIPFSW